MGRILSYILVFNTHVKNEAHQRRDDEGFDREPCHYILIVENERRIKSETIVVQSNVNSTHTYVQCTSRKQQNILLRLIASRGRLLCGLVREHARVLGACVCQNCVNA